MRTKPKQKNTGLLPLARIFLMLRPCRDVRAWYARRKIKTARDAWKKCINGNELLWVIHNLQPCIGRKIELGAGRIVYAAIDEACANGNSHKKAEAAGADALRKELKFSVVAKAYKKYVKRYESYESSSVS